MKRFTLRLILLLVLCSVLVSHPRINMAKASGTIYIRADGLVDPPTAPIRRDGDTYAFIDNVHESIVVARSNIVIDGVGYAVEGDGGPESGSGFSLYNISNVIIKNTNIKGFTFGFHLELASNNTISGNNITANNLDGIRLYHSSNNAISGNNITKNNFDGIYLGSSSNNAISGNNITKNGYGVRIIDFSNYNAVSGNNITANNLVGIYLGSSSNNAISGNNITANNLDGIRLYHSSNNAVSGNNITKNGYGIRVFYSSSNILTGNCMADNDCNFGIGDGLTLSDFANDVDVSNTVDGNPVYYWINRQDVAVPFDAGYVALVNCTRITIKNLNLTNNVQGLLLASTTNSTIVENSVTDSCCGIYLYESSNNRFYHNNVIGNIQQVYVKTSGYANFWDDGYPSGGNYWSDYKDRYPDAAEIDQSGIWNTQYFIDPDNVDNYPLTSPQSDTTPPTLSILSPENKTYAASDVPLNFTLSEPTSWIGYSLDGQANVTVGGNTTLSGLSDGSHTLTVYAKDMAGNAGTSERVCFSIDTQEAEPFPAWIVVAIVATTGVGVALLVYFVKVKKTTGKVK